MTVPTVRGIGARLVRVPMRRPLGTSASRITEAPLLLLDLTTHEGVTGRGYLFCYREAAGHAMLPLVAEATALLADSPAAPAAVRRTMAGHHRLLGVRGLVSGVLAALDMACWDALAVAAEQPLARLLGAEPRALPAYNSNGLGLLDPAEAADEAVELAEGFAGVKMRLGRPDAAADLAAVRAVRAALPAGTALMADFNQALRLDEARQRCRMLDGEGLSWLEEPIRHDDHTGAAELAATLETPVQLGENFTGPRAMARALAAGASDFVMPDADRIGGVTGWQAAAALADAAGVPMSCHLYPEVSAHLLAATPTAHWLEYVDWADPILIDPVTVAGGHVTAADRPGSGLAWDEQAVARFRVG
ncbi:mandelate racemase [Amycolatopsis acidiphila]|uniref:Mandelate racemase n=1 Tax=Amycolatopsis acidiphila TaxID=715473 RepID=A0A557ZXT8_9PSEU|nr:enolase C-terminal domain-like protein [Amycolatopsis acidiphila]TVT16825.1 mandelate racemase [Amycolatopsis acidiphila]UIJ63027.1 mandelate racemase [Amycolatopsis acidiphila]GHG65725.1 mandelate racemase [Amycolatopsis acidiphila]